MSERICWQSDVQCKFCFVANVPKLLHFGGVFFLHKNSVLSTIYKYQNGDFLDILHFLDKKMQPRIEKEQNTATGL